MILGLPIVCPPGRHSARSAASRGRGAYVDRQMHAGVVGRGRRVSSSGIRTHTCTRPRALPGNEYGVVHRVDERRSLVHDSAIVRARQGRHFF